MVAENTKRCRAMKDAGITYPESQDGKDFCTKMCPYPDGCILFDVEVGPLQRQKVKIKSRVESVKYLLSQGMNIREIARYLGINEKTVERDLKRKLVS